MTTSDEPVVACSLAEQARRRRAEELRGGLLGRIERVRDLPDGVALRFPAADLDAVREFAAFESGCCGFASFEIRPEGGGEFLWLEIRGPAGTAEFVHGWLPAAPTERDSNRLLRSGLVSVAGAAGALLLCATPALALLLGAVGLGGTAATIGRAADVVAIPLLLAALAVVGFALLRQRRAHARTLR
jgi:hypothetical protein